MSAWRPPQLRTVAATLAVASAIALVCWLVAPDLYAWASDPEAVRAFVGENALASRAVLVGANVAQVLLAILPGEPIELAMGYAFGAWEGTVLCLLSAAIGTTLIWLVVRRWGRPLVSRLFGETDLERFSWLSRERELGAVMFVVFLVPGTPKDFLTYFAGLTKLRIGPVLAIATLGRLPSIVTSTIAASAAGDGNWGLVAATLGVAAALAAVGVVAWRRWGGRDPSA